MLRNKLAFGLLAGLGLGLLQFAPLCAQTTPDTLRLTLAQTEQKFLENNLQLLAAHYNVQGDSALIRQARLWDNPNLTFDQNVYSNKKFFEHGTDPVTGQPTGQFYVQLQQLILLGGKRRKQVKLAATTAGISQLQFRDLLRGLKQQLRNDYFTVVQLQGNEELYRTEMKQLGQLYNGMKAQFQAGNIAKKELFRVEALQMSVEQELTDNAKQLDDTQTELKTLLQLDGATYIKPAFAEQDNPPALLSLAVPQLVDQAKENNTTYQLELLQLQYQQFNLSYQKALAVPDLTVGPNYDHNSNYTPNYFGLTLGIPLPLLNRNQGNIKSARYNVQQEETNLKEVMLELQNNVQNSYRKLQMTLNLSQNQQQEFYKNYNELYKNIIESYNKRQISLLEFIDYFKDYEDIREKQLQQALNVHLAQEDLNYQVGADVTH